MRHHTIARSLPRIALAALTLCVLAAGLVWPGAQATPASAAPSCPADQRHLILWQGRRWFLSGVNVPWLGGGFGADFGTVEHWGQHTYTSAATERMFAQLKAAGANSVRWWVFADGRGAPEFANGVTSGFDAGTLPAMADAISLAQKHNISLTFTLWSFDMLARGDGTVGGRRDLIIDPVKCKAYIDRALIPMLRFPVPGTSYTIGTHPNVLSWEVINEPEWGIREAGSVHGTIPEPVSLQEMQRFVAETAGAIHRNSNQLVTVGSAAMKWNSTAAPGAAGNWWSDAALKPFDPQGTLDYYQVHYYGWMNGGAGWSYSPLKVSWQGGGFDKPVVVGELPANASGTGLGIGDLLEGIFGNCYAGAWAWSYTGVDGNGGWASLAGTMTRFNAAHRAEVTGGGVIPPAPGTPVPTSAPPRPTVSPPPVSGTAELPIYRDALAEGWRDDGWGVQTNLAATEERLSGASSIAARFTTGWSAVRLQRTSPLPRAGLRALRLALHGGPAGGPGPRVGLRTSSGAERRLATVTLAGGQWQQLTLPLPDAAALPDIASLVLQDDTGTVPPPFFLDEVALLTMAGAPAPAPTTPPPAVPSPVPTSAPPTATAAPTTGVLRVMPLGDSITEGVNGGYRNRLWQRLTADGRAVDFVGPRYDQWTRVADKDHAGTSGYTVGNILGQIDGWLAAYRPDVVLLMAGTNDLAWWHVEGPENTAARLGALLDRIRERSPQTLVVVASLPPMSGTAAPNNRSRDELARAYNAAVRAQVEQRKANGAPLAFADVYAALTVADLYDGVHPTEAAHNRIADVWYDALGSTGR
ncbi:MAG TPA: SGNH/GDSL hydrolase family protein [Chloroflexaceae bacterium]|nr:SGNH/GDSL hydrolase family protein [Chloroflexaceae bacterium]